MGQQYRVLVTYDSHGLSNRHLAPDCTHAYCPTICLAMRHSINASAPKPGVGRDRAVAQLIHQARCPVFLVNGRECQIRIGLSAICF